MPGAGNFPLNAVYDKPKDRNEMETMRQYMTQLRQELAGRLVERIYSPAYADTLDGKRPSKWWICFQKRKFMNKTL
jgi:actin related protein 2/3 complex subunit 3